MAAETLKARQKRALQQVTVFAFPLAASAAEMSRFHEVLSQDERERSARFTSAALRDGYVLAHGLSRLLIGRCLGCAPDAIVLRSTADGKPFVASLSCRDGKRQGEQAVQTASPRASPCGFQFNLSHSGSFGDGVALLATSFGAPVGVDIERGRPVSAGLAGRYFAAGEAAALERFGGAGTAAAERAFLAYWTAKEACLKAWGLGLKGGLHRFVLCDCDDIAGDWVAMTDRTAKPQEAIGANMVRRWPLNSVPVEAGSTSEWSVFQLDLADAFPGQDVVGAVAVNAADCDVAVRRVPDYFVSSAARL